MSEYSGRILGDLPATCHKDRYYFEARFCFVDCRGPFEVHPSAYFGLGVKVITTGHELTDWPNFGRMIFKPVRVGDGAWIGSFAVLHNCTIGAHALVSIGAVVNGIVVPDYGVAVGNPAKVVGYMYKGVVLSRERFMENMQEDIANKLNNSVL